MKILVIAPYFYPKVGGMENYAYNISKGLRDLGWGVVVITSNHIENKFSIEDVEGLKVYRLPILFKISNTPINPFWIFSIRKIINSEKPDVINAHTPVPYISDIAAAVSNKTPFVLTYHAATLYKNHNYLFNTIIFIYKKLVEANTLNVCSMIITESDYVKEKLPKKIWDKVDIIYNSINKQDITPLKASNKDSNTLIFLANLEKTHIWKGLNYILESIKWYIDNINNNIQLLILGDGDYRKQYERSVNKLGISKYVKFLGTKSGEEKRDLIQKATILLAYPYTSNDAFPTVFLEAWANNTVIVASDIEPIPHIISNGQDGFLVTSKNPVLLAKAINHVLTNIDLQQQLVINGRNKVLGLTWDIQSNVMDRLLRSLL